MTNNTQTSTATGSASATSNKPAAEFRYGNVRAVIWANQNDNGISHSVKLTRSYTKDGQWFDTDYLNRGDIFKAIEALRDAGRFMLSTSGKSASAESADEAAPPGQYN